MPNHKNPWSEPPDHGIGRSRGGLTTKLHLVCDGRGRPLSMMITAGNINDTTMMTATLEEIHVPRRQGRPRQRPDRVLADKGYPSKKNRAWLRGRKIAATITALGVDRFDLKYASGPMPHEQLMESIRLYGTEVIPRVRELLSEQVETASAVDEG